MIIPCFPINVFLFAIIPARTSVSLCQPSPRHSTIVSLAFALLHVLYNRSQRGHLSLSAPLAHFTTSNWPKTHETERPSSLQPKFDRLNMTPSVLRSYQPFTRGIMYLFPLLFANTSPFSYTTQLHITLLSPNHTVRLSGPLNSTQYAP